MPGAKSKRGTGARRAGSARPALGNDPFLRGAAPRVPTPTPTPTPTPAQPPLPAELHARLDPALHEDARRSDAAAPSAAPAGAGGRDDLRAAVESLWPAVRDRLSAALDLVRLLEPPERLDRFGMDPRFCERALPLVELLYASWWRVAARGLEHVPDDGPAVVVANHAGLLPWDALVLRHALLRDHPAHRDLRPLLDDAECDRPFSGGLAVRLGAVRSDPAAAARLLGDGSLVGVFPEGSAAEARPWRERYRITRFGRGGFARVALRAGAPIIPCAIVGSEEAAPAISRTGWLAELLRLPLLAAQPSFRLSPAGLLPLPSRWTLRFGPAVDLGGLGPEAAGSDAVVAEVAERTRRVLQAMLDEDVAARTSVYL